MGLWAVVFLSSSHEGALLVISVPASPPCMRGKKIIIKKAYFAFLLHFFLPFLYIIPLELPAPQFLETLLS